MNILLPYLEICRRHKWMLILGIVLTVITLLSSIGLLTLSGWFLSSSAVIGVVGLYTFNYMLPAAGVRVSSIIRTSGRYFERLVSHDATFRVLQYLRVFIFSRLIRLSPARLAHFRYGELLNCVVADVDTLDHLYLRVIVPIFSIFIVIFVVTLSLSILDIRIAMTLGGIMLLTLFLVPPVFYHAGKSIGENLIRFRAEYRRQLTSWLDGQTELLLFGSSQNYRLQMDNTELNWHAEQRKQLDLTALSQAIVTLIGGISVVTILLMGFSILDANPKPNSLISLFVFCTLAVLEAISPAVTAFQHLGQVIASAIRITNLTEQPPEVIFSKENIQLPDLVALRLQHVTFSYDRQIHPVLNDLTLDIFAGEHVAILGQTGCGKSTLLQLITRAWDPKKGFISINGIPLTTFSEVALRSTMSMVTQRVYLFSATLRENLLIASPHANDEEFIAVLEKVGLKILLKGEGLNSWMGEGGRFLSGGELRRLGIARCLLHDAPLMLLDEPTEGLDPNSEIEILDLLKVAMKDKTILMVTHRLRALKDFDRIIVMDNGRIIEQGSHLDLLMKKGRYYQLRQRF